MLFSTLLQEVKKGNEPITVGLSFTKEQIIEIKPHAKKEYFKFCIENRLSNIPKS